jgi:hypothetical protein
MVFLESLCYDRMGWGLFVLGSAVYISVYDTNLSLNGEGSATVCSLQTVPV